MNVRRVLFVSGWLSVAGIGLVVGSSRGIVASDGADEKSTGNSEQGASFGSHLRSGRSNTDPKLEEQFRALIAPAKSKPIVQTPIPTPTATSGATAKSSDATDEAAESSDESDDTATSDSAAESETSSKSDKGEVGREVRIDEPREADAEQPTKGSKKKKAASSAKPKPSLLKRLRNMRASKDGDASKADRFESPVVRPDKAAPKDGWRRGSRAAKEEKTEAAEDHANVETTDKEQPYGDAEVKQTPAAAETANDSTVKDVAEKAEAHEATSSEAAIEERPAEEAKKARTSDAPIAAEPEVAEEPVALEPVRKDIETEAAPFPKSQPEAAPAEKTVPVKTIPVDEPAFNEVEEPVRQHTEAPAAKEAREPAFEEFEPVTKRHQLPAHKIEPAQPVETALPSAEPTANDEVPIESVRNESVADEISINERRMEHIRADETAVQDVPTETIAQTTAPAAIPHAAPSEPSIQQTANQVPQYRTQTAQAKPQQFASQPQPATTKVNRVQLPNTRPQAPAEQTQPEAQPAQVAAQPPQAAAAPSPETAQRTAAVLGELEKIYQENGREMPSMRLQDAPQTQPLPGNIVSAPEVQNRTDVVEEAPRKKPNMLQRIFRLRGSKQSAVDAQPSATPHMAQAQTRNQRTMNPPQPFNQQQPAHTQQQPQAAAFGANPAAAAPPVMTQPATAQPAMAQPMMTQPAATQPAMSHPAPAQPAMRQPVNMQPAVVTPPVHMVQTMGQPVIAPQAQVAAPQMVNAVPQAVVAVPQPMVYPQPTATAPIVAAPQVPQQVPQQAVAAMVPPAQPQYIVTPATQVSPQVVQIAPAAPAYVAAPQVAAAPTAAAPQQIIAPPVQAPIVVAEPQRIATPAAPIAPVNEQQVAAQPAAPQPAAIPRYFAPEQAHPGRTTIARAPALAMPTAPADPTPVQRADFGLDASVPEPIAEGDAETKDGFNPFTGLTLTDGETAPDARAAETKTAAIPAQATAAMPSVATLAPAAALPMIISNSEPGRVRTGNVAGTAMPTGKASVDKQQAANVIREVAERSGKPGIKGFCLVALREERELVDSQPEFRATFEGRDYYFSSAKSQAKFEENPTRYLPAAGGADLVVLAHTSQAVPGTLEYSLWYRGQLYMFSSSESRQTFMRNPQRYLAAISSGAPVE